MPTLKLGLHISQGEAARRQQHQAVVVEVGHFLHHPLIMKSATQKVSKSDGDTGVRDLRARGWTAERVVGHAAALAGLIPEARDVRPDDLSSMMSAFNEVLL